jgi:hypothetical protein
MKRVALLKPPYENLCHIMNAKKVVGKRVS